MTEHYSVVLKQNNTITNDPCAICGERCDPNGLDFFMEGTEHLVCNVCAYKYAPELFRMHWRYWFLSGDIEAGNSPDPWGMATPDFARAAEECPRCGCIEHGHQEHYQLCRYPDGTPTELTDEEVRRAIGVMEKRAAMAADLNTEEIPF